MKVFYHNDLDGRCSAAIFNYYLVDKKESKDVTFIEMNYSDNVQVKSILDNEEIIILDFSFKPKVMNKIREITKNITWIDHHKTTQEYEKQYNIKIDGIRNYQTSYADREAACEITWRFYFPLKEMPEAVKLIGDRDKWTWKYGERTENFTEGIELYNQDPNAELWFALFNNDKLINKIIQEGKICVRYRDKICEEYLRKYGFEMNFEGYKCYAKGLSLFGGKAFGNKIKEYDICINLEFLGKKWIVGLYSEKIDVSKIAKKYGGGGHKGAAGFVIENKEGKGIKDVLCHI